MNRGYLSHCRFENPKTFCVSKCNSIKKSSWNAHLGMPLFLNMPPKAASLPKEVLQKKTSKTFQRLLHPFERLPTKIMITDTTIIIRIMIEATVFIVLLKHRSQASQPSIVAKHRRQASQPSIAVKHRSQASQPSIAAKHRRQGCAQNNENYTYPEMSDISIFEFL